VKTESLRRRAGSGPVGRVDGNTAAGGPESVLPEAVPAGSTAPDDAGGMRALLAISRDAVLVVRRADRRILEVSPSAEQIYGLRAEALRTLSYGDLVTSQAGVDDIFVHHREHVPLRYHRRADGSRFPVEMRIHWTAGTADMGELGYFRVRDLSRMEQEERQLRAARAGYQAIFRAAPFPVLLLDRRGAVSDANEAALALYVHSAASLVGMPVSALLRRPADTRDWFRRPHSSLTAQWHRRSDGQMFLADVEVSIVCFSAEVHAIVVVHDTTEAHNLMERLRASEARWRFAIEGHGDVLWEWDLQQHRFQLSRALPYFPEGDAQVLDEDPEHWGARVHPVDRSRFRRDLVAHLKGETPLVDSEVRLMVPGGAQRWVWLRGRVLERDATGRALRLLGSVRDIHDSRQQAEELVRWREQVLHTSRVTSMGEMAATLAHELNQPLTAIRNFSAAALRQMEAQLSAPAPAPAFAPGPAPEAGAAQRPAGLRLAVELIAEEAMRAGRILHHIHNFARKGSLHLELLSLNDLVAGFQRFAEMQAGRAGVHIELELTVGLPKVQVDPVLIEQLLFNLVRNGVEAMGVVPVPEPGVPPPPPLSLPAQEDLRIEIATAPGQPGEVELQVLDRGRGLPDDRVQDIYAPFVSNKSGGLGMGLAICRSIVESHHGRLWATPRPGGGTVFHVGLPVPRAEPVSTSSSHEAEHASSPTAAQTARVRRR
jgi:two-component system sensor kinase FixL